MKNYIYGLTTGFIIILIFSFNYKGEKSVKTEKEIVISQKAEEVPLILKDQRSHEFYVTQAKLWKEVVSKDSKNENAWFNLFKANRFAKLTYNSKHSPELSWRKNKAWIREADHLMTGNDIISQIEKNIPKTFMAYYLKFYNKDVTENKDFYLLEKAYAINPEFYEIYDDFVIHYELESDRENRKKFNLKWFESNDFSENLLNYYYNVLMTLKQNSLLFSYGDNDLLAPFMLQDALNVRNDVTIINIGLMVEQKEYRNTIFKRLKISSFDKEYSDGWSDNNMKEIIDHILKNKPKNLPVYFGLNLSDSIKKNYEEQLYLVGLALEYSETNIDNLAELKKNYNDKYLLDYIGIQFSHDSYEVSANVNYIHGISLLYEHYKTSEDLNKAKEMKGLALTIANKIKAAHLQDYKENVINYFSKH